MDDLKEYIGRRIAVWTKKTHIPLKGKLLTCGSESITIADIKGKTLISDSEITSVQLELNE